LAGRTARRRVLRTTLPGGPAFAAGDPEAGAWEDSVRTESRADLLAVEEPLGLRVNGAALTLTMRTPGDDIELAAGFLVSEAVVSSSADIAEIKLYDGRPADVTTTAGWETSRK
jgi:formate dehydrogenase assembly factor FdhD